MKKKKSIKLLIFFLTILTVVLQMENVNAESSLTYDSFCDNYSKYIQEDDLDGYYDYVKSLDGEYQSNGAKICCVLNGTTKKIKKEGLYSIIVGGKTNKKDEGTVKFIAPSSGTYSFTFDVRDNIARDLVIIEQRGSGNLLNAKVNYHSDYSGVGTIKQSSIFLLAGYDTVYYWTGEGHGHLISNMNKISGKVYLKKGQYICFTGRSYFSYDIDDAYNFTGYDLKIVKK